MTMTDQVAGSEEPQIVVAAMVVTDEAVAIGITAMPDPVSNPDADWYWYADAPTGITVATAVGFQTNQVFEFDSKAMRKVSSNQDIIVVAANRSAADGGFVVVSGRELFKLH